MVARGIVNIQMGFEGADKNPLKPPEPPIETWHKQESAGTHPRPTAAPSRASALPGKVSRAFKQIHLNEALPWKLVETESDLMVKVRAWDKVIYFAVPVDFVRFLFQVGEKNSRNRYRTDYDTEKCVRKHTSCLELEHAHIESNIAPCANVVRFPLFLFPRYHLHTPQTNTRRIKLNVETGIRQKHSPVVVTQALHHQVRIPRLLVYYIEKNQHELAHSAIREMYAPSPASLP
jgi:hypothetical protein